MNIKFIKLSKNNYAIVDEDHFDHLSQFNWHIDAGGYAKRAYTMHEAVNGFPPPKMVIDHVNGDKSDNRKGNLRFVTRSQNNLNIRLKSNNTSGKTGVLWKKNRSKWMAMIRLNGKNKSLGSFLLKEDAIEARIAGEKIYYGEFASSVCRGGE